MTKGLGIETADRATDPMGVTVREDTKLEEWMI
jgi:hypothetical protein